MATTAAVQGAGLVTGVWKKLEKAIFNAGGTEEHLARLDKQETDEAFANFAAEIVRTITVVINSFRDQIRVGRYDYTYGFANNTEEIKGQSFHPVTNETKLDHPGQRLTTQQVFDRFGDKMATLSELLDYGIKNPDTQREFPIGIVWKDETGQFWFAYLSGSGLERRLSVFQVHPAGELPGDFRFLLRKSA